MATPFYKVEVGQASTTTANVASVTTSPTLSFRPGMGDLNIIHPEEERGVLAAYHRSYVASKLAEGTLEGDATFEEITIPLCLAILDADGTSMTTAGPGYSWSFEPAWSTSNDPGIWTIEFGDDVQAFEMGYVFGTNLNISGSTEEEWSVSCDVVGQAIDTCTFTGSAVTTGYDVETILMQETMLYMTTDSTGIDTTTDQVEGAFLDFDFTLPDHYKPRFTADGELYFSGIKECKIAPELELTLVVDADTKDQITDYYQNQTQQIIRIQADGSEITTGTNKFARIEMCGIITDVSELADDDCDTVITLTFVGEYNATYGSVFSIELQNELNFPYGEAS